MDVAGIARRRITATTIAASAALIADPARTAILMLLVDGRARPAGDLAFAAGATAQTASSHTAKGWTELRARLGVERHAVACDVPR